ncbi:DUF2125 domain-containing protein [Cribrihabitans neustonicus]|uniref:DUF2125 domain-containing protein n=1 Tax=Cribrihabitans neustonicus TaxID=1429085 RepID=UPI003B594552
MSAILARSGTAAALVFFSAQGALAGLTAQEVWDGWKSYLTGTGYAVEASETLSGGTLTISGLTMTAGEAAAEGSARISLPEIRLEENGDGSVSVLMPADMPVAFAFTGPEEDVSGTLIYGHDGSPVTVTGDASEMTYTYAAPELTLDLKELKADGEVIPPEAAQFSMALQQAAAETTMKADGTRTYGQELSAAGLTYHLAFVDPENEAKGSFKGALEGLAFSGSSTIPVGLESPDMAALLDAGAGFGGRFTFTSGSGAIAGSGDGESFAMETRSGGGAVDVSLNGERLTYDLSQRDAEVNISGTEMPFPLSLRMAEAGLRLMMPVTGTGAEQDFALGVTLRDFALPEMFWGMVDPTGVLPHDPATLVLDIAGKGKLLFDIFDPESIAPVESGSQPPGEVNALTVKELRLSAAGAELTGTGDFTFDNEDLESFGGIPAPSGEANLMLTGANALLDKLIQLGVMADSDAMGVRMMMGMLAVPGEGEDSLKSRIEITEDGKILANGQRLK